MGFKKYFLVICLIICLFTIASACASEVNDTEISAIDSDDNLEINEDNQVMDNDNGGLSGNSSAKDDNVGLPAQQRDENSDSDKLGITDGDLIGDELNAKVVALNVTVADKPMFVVDCADKFNGNVAIRIGENKSIYDGSVKALIEADRLPAGNYVATALFYGDSNYENLTQNNIMFTVSRLTPTIDVNIEDVTYPNTAYANVHVGNYANSTSDVIQLFVNKVITGMEISIDKNSMSYHDFAVVSIDLNQSINAIVTVKVNGNNHTVGLVNGKGSFTLYDLDKGDYIINAVFAGDDKHKGCISDPLNLTVTGDNISSPVSISLNKYSIFVGDEVIGAVNMNPTVKGIVRLNIGSKFYDVVVNRGVGTFAISDLEMGTYDVQAIFGGDNEHSASSSDVKILEVKKIPTNFTVTIDNPSIFVGDKAVFAVNTNPAVTGIVRLNIGSESYDVVVNGGVGTFAISDLEMGAYDVRAIFDGDNKYLGNSSDVKQLEVKKIPTCLAVSMDNPSIFVGDSVVVGVVLNQTINNVVIVNVNDKNYLMGIVNGKGNLTLSGLTFGTYTVNATFAGEGKYAKSGSNNVSLEVNKIKTQLIADSITVTYNGNSNLVITLKDTNGNAVRNANVIVNINGAKTLTTDSNGQVKLSTNGLAPNVYTAKITFDGNAVYDISSKEVKVTVKKATPVLTAKTKTFKAKVKTKKHTITLKDNAGKAIKNVKVTLKVKGKTFKATVSSTGKATFKITNLKKKGNYKAVITYGGNNLYNKVTKNVKIKVS